MSNKLFNRDFTLVIIGQIISLFGNCALRLALPLYLLNQTGSSAIYGTVTALAFIPAIILSPIGGIIADRVNKRNIMVILDFFTALVLILFYIILGHVNLIALLIVTLMILYGIAGAYQPSVQSSIPFLVSESNIMPANSVINIISSLSQLLGPIIGGILYSAYGIKPVLILCTICFIISAVMEIFIHIPFKKQQTNGNILNIAKNDFSDSIRFIRKDKPIIGKVLLAVCAYNLFLSAMLIVGLPYLITEVLTFSEAEANKLYGFAEGALAAGGLLGGILSGVLAKKLDIQKAGNLLLLSAICLFPMGISLIFFKSAMLNYIVITICCFALMCLSMVFQIQMMSFVQAQTPQNLIGKVIALIMTVSMCSQPLGNALYGVLFDFCNGFEYAVIFFAGVMGVIICIITKGFFNKYDFKNDRMIEITTENQPQTES